MKALKTLIVVVVLAGLYFWFTQESGDSEVENAVEQTE